MEVVAGGKQYVLMDYDGFDVKDGVEFIDDRNAELIWSRLESIMKPDTYWNIERVRSNLDKFIVLGYFEREIQGALYAQIYKDSSVEVFGIAAEKPEVAESLISTLVYKCGKLRSKRLWLYTDEEAEVELAIGLGFIYYDSNKCFMKII